MARRERLVMRQPLASAAGGDFGARERNLERAKGLEPSTPTLARSCSTTELHPHPRWRRSLAVNGRPMPNADRECNSWLTVRRQPENPVSSINGPETLRNNGQTGFRRPASGTPGLAAGGREAD